MLHEINPELLNGFWTHWLRVILRHGSCRQVSTMEFSPDKPVAKQSFVGSFGWPLRYLWRRRDDGRAMKDDGGECNNDLMSVFFRCVLGPLLYVL